MSLFKKLSESAKNKIAVNEAKDDEDGEYGQEGAMAKSQLRMMINSAKRLHSMLQDDDELPGHVISDIVLATDYITGAADYMESEMAVEDDYNIDEALTFHAVHRAPSLTSAAAKTPVSGDTPTYHKSEAEAHAHLNKKLKKVRDGVWADKDHSKFYFYKKIMNEEVEQIDEVSKALLKRYKAAAKGDEASQHDAAVKIGDKQDDKRISDKTWYGLQKQVAAHEKSYYNRRRGQALATKKIGGRAKINATEEVELDEETMPGNVALRMADRHTNAAMFHKKNGNMKGYAAHMDHAEKIEDAVMRAGRDMPVRSKAFDDKSTKIFSAHPHPVSRNEEFELDEVSTKTLRSYLDKAKPNFLRATRAKLKGSTSAEDRADRRANGIAAAKKRLGEEAELDEKAMSSKELARAAAKANDEAAPKSKVTLKKAPWETKNEAASYRDIGAQNMMRASQKADKEADKVRAQAAKEAAKKAAKEVQEDVDFKVSIQGLPKMFVKAKSEGDAKTKLRKVVKNPDMIQDVTRVTKADVKNTFRDFLSGKVKDEDLTESPEEMKKPSLNIAKVYVKGGVEYAVRRGVQGIKTFKSNSDAISYMRELQSKEE